MTSRSEETDLEGPFRAPEQLVLAMPLVAVVGLMIVVCAVVMGGSTLVVAIGAVGGFGLCAIVPMTLIELYVTRPMRGALSQLRAARDGRAIDAAPAFASGVVADLVAVARDIQAAQASLGQQNAAQDQCERLILASDEAAQALRRHADDLTEAARAETQRKRSLPAQLAEISEAVAALRDAPPGGALDAAVERLESMLVYIAEALERSESKNKTFERAFGRLEQGVADLSRLVAREREAAPALPSPLAREESPAEGEKAARVLERLESLETLLAAKLSDAMSPDTRKLADTIRAEAEATRRALREPDAGRLDAVAESLAKKADEIGQAISQWEHVVQAGQNQDQGQELRALIEAVEKLAGAAQPGLEPAALTEILRAELAGIAEALARPAADAVAGPEGLRAHLREIAGDLSDKIADVARRLDAPQPENPAGEILARGLAELSERLRAEREAEARRLDEIEGNVADKVLAIGRDNESTTLMALLRATKQIGEAAARLDGVLERPSGEGQPVAAVDIEGLRPFFAEVEARVAGAAAGAQRGADDPALAQIASSAKALEEKLDALAASLPAAVVPAQPDALAPAQAALASAQTRLDEVAARIEAGAQAVVASMRDEFAVGSPEALEPARAALHEAAQKFEAAQARAERATDGVQEAAARIEAGAGAAVEAMRAQFEAVASALPDALQPGSAALHEAAARFEAAQARAERGAEGAQEAAARIEAGLAALSETMRGLGEAQARLEAALAPAEGAPTSEAALEALRADFAAAAQAAAAQAEEAAGVLTRKVEDCVGSLRRGEFTPAVLALQSTTQELNKANAELFAVVETLRASPAPAEASAGGADLDALTRDIEDVARVLFERLTALEGGVAQTMGDVRETTRALGVRAATSDRTAQAGLQALREDVKGALARLEAAAGPSAAPPSEDSPGLQNLADAVADAGAKIEALARAQEARLDGLEQKLAASAVMTNNAAVASALSVFRALTGSLQEAVETFEQFNRKVGAHAAPAEARSSAAMAKLAASMADALDVRFLQIEAAVKDLSNRPLAHDGAGEKAALDAGLATLASQLDQACETLKSGLAQFVGLSAALVDGAGGPSSRADFRKVSVRT